MPELSRMYGWTRLLVIITVSLGVSQARADLVVVFSPAFDGGVDMIASGTTVGSTGQSSDNRADLPLQVDNLFGPNNMGINSDAQGGSITINGNTTNILQIQLLTFGTNDSVAFIVDADAGFGPMTANNVTATWNVGTLAFASLTPGTYAGTVAGSSAIVVPEPSALSLFGLASVALWVGRKKGTGAYIRPC